MIITENELRYIIREVASLLSEATVASVRPYYQDIPDEVFSRLVSIDPSCNGTKGKYFTWVLDLFKNKDENGRRAMLQNAEAIRNDLDIFRKNYNKLGNINLKNIGSEQELHQILDNALNGVADNPILSGIDNMEVRKGTKVALNGSTWLIIIPENYAADRHWGANTTWCTAADNDGTYYEKYLKEYGGCYYILINKSNKNEKYQFHFESSQFMNADDEQIGSGVRDLDNFEELDAFFSKVQGEDWVEKVEQEGSEDWEAYGPFNDSGSFYILYNNNTYHYKIVDENYEDAFDEEFDSLEPITEETGCAEFEDLNGRYGLLYVNWKSNDIEKYVWGLTGLDGPKFRDNESFDWFYKGYKEDGTIALITNYSETMEDDYRKIEEVRGTEGYTLVGVTDYEYGIRIFNNESEGFDDFEDIDGDDFEKIKNGLVVTSQKKNAYLYSFENGKVADLPFVGDVRICDYSYVYGYVNGNPDMMDVYNIHSGNMLFGKPIGNNVKILPYFSGRLKMINSVTGDTVVFYSLDENGGEFYREGARGREMISMENAYEILAKR